MGGSPTLYDAKSVRACAEQGSFGHDGDQCLDMPWQMIVVIARNALFVEINFQLTEFEERFGVARQGLALE